MGFAIPVSLMHHNPAWVQAAERYSAIILASTPNVIAVHHIGSTGIKGIKAKPVIDLMPIVSNLMILDEQADRIEALGYVWRGEFGVDGRRFCTLDDAKGVRQAQLHIYETGSPHARRQLAFRDYLRAHPAIAKDYSAEKERASALHPHNSHAYSAEKGDWIRAVEAAALNWFGTTSASKTSLI